MDEQIVKLESYSLSGTDMLKYGPKGSKLLTYKELTECKNIDSALGDTGILILLYLTTGDNYGHWCCVFKRNNDTIEFFDSYGKIIDEPLHYADYDVRKRNNEVLPYLSKLLYDSYYKIEYNDHRLQSSSNNRVIATCGRHVLCRLAARELDIDTYVKKMFYNKKYDPDFIVTYLTSLIK